MTAQAPAENPAQVLVGLIAGAWLAQAISVVARFGIADLLRDGPRHPADLAAQAGVHEGALRRVMRALASHGIFAEDGEGQFALTPRAEALRSDDPASLRAYAAMMGERWVWRSFGEIEHTLRTGDPALPTVFGAPLFALYEADEEARRTAFEGLASVARGQDAAILSAYGFDGEEPIVDVGGGQGALLRSILAARPRLRGVLLDRPDVIARAGGHFDEAGLGGRVELVPGDFFVEVPSGGGTYVLKKVLHDWDRERALAILRRVRAAMGPGSRLLVIETVVPEGNEPSYAKLLDLLMLVYAGGEERTVPEHRALLAQAGLALRRVVPTTSTLTILEAVSV